MLHTDSGRVVLRSRRGTEMAPAFPDITAAAAVQLPDATALDGELVVWEGNRFALERLQNRLSRGVPRPRGPRKSGRCRSTVSGSLRSRASMSVRW
ncbi:DNA ligase-like domain-containing protein [Streptomyces sp. ME109]|uniref:hypothetical protein n=1 Tax=Streptomyces sp. me109 TaxID=1827853 RepID=UPI0021CAAE3B|nr:hypothetical protein [Streptomyces sp. me109]